MCSDAQENRGNCCLISIDYIHETHLKHYCECEQEGCYGIVTETPS